MGVNADTGTMHGEIQSMVDKMNKTSDDEDNIVDKATEKFIVELDIEREKTNCDKAILFGKNGEDVAYRHRLLHTACVWFSLFALGWRNSLIGPTLPDLRLIIDEDLSTASWIFTARSLGAVIGAACGGFSYDRFNKIGVFIFFLCGTGVFAGITPWCSHLVTMLAVHFLHGIFSYALETAAMADVAVIWRHKAGPFMQAVQFAFGVGAILSPLVSEPFLAAKIHIDSRFNLSLSNTSITAIDSSTVSKISGTSRLTTLEPDSRYAQPYTTDTITASLYGESRIYIPYSITTIICFLSASLFVLLCCVYGNVYNKALSGYSNENTKSSSQKQYFLNRKMTIIFTILLALTLVLYIVSEHCFVGFSMTFLTTELSWSKSAGSTASAIYWIAFTIGRLSGIVAVKFVNLSVVMLTFFFILSIGAVVFLLAVIYETEPAVWVAVMIIGYGMSVIFASVFSWFSEHIRTLTGIMSSIFFICMATGSMVVPVIVGNLMDKVSQLWFIYSQLIIIGTMFTNFVFVFVLYTCLKRKLHKK